MDAVKASQLTKTFINSATNKPVTALSDISLTAKTNRLTALTGPDGAGKTTFMRLVCGLMKQDGGDLFVLGRDVSADPQSVQDRLSYMPQRFGLYEDLSVQENLNLYADLHSIPEKDRSTRFTKLLSMTGMLPFTGRLAGKLSGGMKQKLGLACTLVRIPELLLLDEPSIGLHQRDNARLIETLERLRDLGNTLIVVEHDEDTIRSADWVVDIGPGAGEKGGEIVYSGEVAGLSDAPGSVTGDYLAGRRAIQVPATRRKPARGRELTVVGAHENNLKDITATIPLGVFTAVTGVSGSGKSSLIDSILYQVLANRLNGARGVPGRHKTVRGLDNLDKVVHVDQSPIGRTPRSNPATYTGVWDHVRKIFAAVPESKVRGYTPGRFSFNVKGGRCEACKGDGTLKIEMNFLPDVYVPCEVCHGARYNRETLEVRYKDRTVADVLDMTIRQAADFFAATPIIARHLNTLVEVGLGYVRLGQAATTLSGGEAQRVKLATELQRRSTGRTVYVLDEPTTGLHFEDIRKLLAVLQGLVDKGNSVIVIEHNLDVIANADWVIDMGPEGGRGGGAIVATGTPERIARDETSYTGRFLAPMLERARG